MKKIPIFLASNDLYAPFLITTAYSILEHTNSWIDFYILDAGITKISKQKMIDSLQKFKNKNLQFVDMSKYNLKQFPNLKHYSLVTFCRYFIPEIAPHLGKVLYLDTDILVEKDISELYNQDLGKYPVGAVLEDFAPNWKYLKEHIFPDYQGKDHYFNAGVMLIDVQKFIQQNIQPILIQKTIELYDKLNCPDQDVLNIVFENNFKILDYKFNFMPDLYHWLQTKHPDIGKINPVIRHYCSGKPWKEPIEKYPEYWNEFKKTNLSMKNFPWPKPIKRYKWYEKIFSIKNTQDKKKKVITILGIKIKLKRNRV